MKTLADLLILAAAALLIARIAGSSSSQQGKTIKVDTSDPLDRFLG